MLRGIRTLLVAAGTLLTLVAAIAWQDKPPAEIPPGKLPVAHAGPRWFKGNLHTHTLNSDGDSAPEEVVRWYREHGYDFLVLTDHNFLTGVDGLNALQGAAGKFLVVRGEEVTSAVGSKPIHVNGFDMRRAVDPPQAATVVDMVQGMVDAIRAAEGAPSINHPNFGWAISAEELAGPTRVLDSMDELGWARFQDTGRFVWAEQQAPHGPRFSAFPDWLEHHVRHACRLAPEALPPDRITVSAKSL